jgi:hypothetical protein
MARKTSDMYSRRQLARHINMNTTQNTVGISATKTCDGNQSTDDDVEKVKKTFLVNGKF